MIVANQQANIKNVNGALADTLANRPAAQSTFYLFYATDTQEIYYDNGAWILLSGGGGGTNIYNSDGTLTTNRTLNGNANFFLSFLNLAGFTAVAKSGLSIGGNIAIQQNFNLLRLFYETGLGTQRRGLRQEEYFPTPEGLNLILGDNTLGHLRFNYNQNIAGFSDSIETSPANWIGLKLDFTNNEFLFGGQYNSGSNIFIQGGSVQGQGNGINAGFIFNDTYITLGDYSNLTNGTQLTIDDNIQIIKTQSLSNPRGLELDFANERYWFGKNNSQGLNIQINGISYTYTFGDVAVINSTYLQINDTAQTFTLHNSGSTNGIRLNFANSTYQFGQINGGNSVKLTFDDTNDRIFTTGISNQVSGLDIYPNLQQFYFGVNSTNNLTHLFINDVAQVGYFANAGFVQGLNLDFANTTYKFGQINGGNETRLEIFDPTGVIETLKPGGVDGLQLNLVNSIYKFGNLTGTNNTYLEIDDLAAFPVQLNGTNLISNTASGLSGLHLKIKVNGVDYKLRLENP
jgi:hypothetical protein